MYVAKTIALVVISSLFDTSTIPVVKDLSLNCYQWLDNKLLYFLFKYMYLPV